MYRRTTPCTARQKKLLWSPLVRRYQSNLKATKAIERRWCGLIKTFCLGVACCRSELTKEYLNAVAGMAFFFFGGFFRVCFVSFRPVGGFFSASAVRRRRAGRFPVWLLLFALLLLLVPPLLGVVFCVVSWVVAS